MKSFLVLTALLSAQISAQRFEPFAFRPHPFPVHPSFYERVSRVMFDAINDFKFSFDREMKKLNCSSIDAEKLKSSSSAFKAADATFTFNLRDNCMVFSVENIPVYEYCRHPETPHLVFRETENFLSDFSHAQPVFVPFAPMERKDWDVEFPINDFPFIPSEFARDNNLLQMPPFPEFNRPEPTGPTPSWNHEIRHASAMASENIKNGWLRDMLFRRTSSDQLSPPAVISDDYMTPRELRIIPHGHLPQLIRK